MIFAVPELNSDSPLSRMTLRRSVVGPMLTLGLLCCTGFAFAAEPSSDATPSPLNMSIIQGFSTSDNMKDAAPEPAPPTAQPGPAAAAPAAAPAASAAPVAQPEPSAGVAPEQAHSQVVVVEMPSGTAQAPAAGSTAEGVEKQLSAFDMGTIRALVSPPGAADAAPAAATAPAAAMQATKAPTPMAAPRRPAAAAEPKPAGEQPLPDSQMELIRNTFAIEGAG
jgi:hypothetical protein